MIAHRNGMKVELKEKMRGGEGTATITNFVDPASMKNARLLAEVVLPVGASIGEHRHDNETEYYIILEGKGTVVDGGKPVPVGPGDVVVTGNGESHSIANSGAAPLKFHAFIVTY